MHIRNIFAAAALAAVVLSAGPVLAAGSSADIPAQSSASASVSPEDAAKAELAAKAKIVAGLHQRTGDITIAEADATLKLGDSYYFLDKEDTRKVLVDVWGNPPETADGILGMVVPKGKTPLDDWGAVITYEKTDYVSDDDAATANYDSYIKQIQDGEKDLNEQRKKDGYAAMHLVGWAQPPSYDRAHHYLIWARDIQFAGESADTLNYDIRLLGRRGVLSLNMVATMPELASIRTQAQQLALAGQYNVGARYQDYQKGDAKAAFGLAGLVAAGLGLAAAKKLGLLAIILAFGKKIIIFVLAGFAAIGRWFSSIFGKKKKASALPARPVFDEPTADTSAPDPATPAEKAPPTEDA